MSSICGTARPYSVTALRVVKVRLMLDHSTENLWHIDNVWRSWNSDLRFVENGKSKVYI